MKTDTQQKDIAFWNSYSKKYDNFIDKRTGNMYIDMLENLKQDLSGTSKLLEVATGTGLLSLQLHSKVKEITATDLSPEMINTAKQKTKKSDVNNVDFMVADCMDLPFEDNSFDAVLASNVLHLIPEPARALSEMKRVVKPDGIFILPTICHGTSPLTRII